MRALSVGRNTAGRGRRRRPSARPAGTKREALLTVAGASGFTLQACGGGSVASSSPHEAGGYDSGPPNRSDPRVKNVNVASEASSARSLKSQEADAARTLTYAVLCATVIATVLLLAAAGRLAYGEIYYGANSPRKLAHVDDSEAFTASIDEAALAAFARQRQSLSQRTAISPRLEEAEESSKGYGPPSESESSGELDA